MTSPCKREDGSFRAHFATAEDALAFQRRPENKLVYGADEIRFCTRCEKFHLSRNFWEKPWEIPLENGAVN
jgi:hypothetical protein